MGKITDQIEPPEEIKVSIQSTVRVILCKGRPVIHYVCVTTLRRGLSDRVIQKTLERQHCHAARIIMVFHQICQQLMFKLPLSGTKRRQHGFKIGTKDKFATHFR